MYDVQVLHHLLRRGLETQASPDAPAPDHPPKDAFEALRGEIPAWGAAIVILTVLAFVVVLVAVRYALMGVVATLAQVETPTKSAYQLDSADDDSTKDPEMAVVFNTPITSSIRATLRHLHSVGGFWAPWRAFAAALCAALAHGLLLQIVQLPVSLLLGQFLGSIIGGVVSTVILARLFLAWTHIVISEPSSLPWYKRIPSFKTWRLIWAPTAINALASQLAMYAPVALFIGLGFRDSDKISHMSALSISWRILLILMTGLVAYLAVVLPSQVALTRCQASLLPEEDETIIPFDRSFGGKVVPQIVGGSGMVSYVDAFKSFDRPTRFRLVKIYAKIFVIDVTLQVAMALLLTVELYGILGSSFNRALGKIHPPQ